MLGNETAQQTITQSSDTFKHITDTLFGGDTGRSLLVLLIALFVGSVIGKLLSMVLRRMSRHVGRRADASSDLNTVNRLRRIETWTILSIAIVRVVCLVLALYFWWVFIHPHGRPTALVGASAVLIVILGGVFSPLLRDFAFGGGMMAEHWFGVGDLITIQPFDIKGVVERITLRSTRIRGLNGEVIWVANQNISSVRIAQKGVWTMALELFVTDAEKAEELLEKTNALLPDGPSLLANPLAIMTAKERADNLWHLTAVGEVAPGREWLIEKTAIDLMKKLDEQSRKPILISDPVARFADNDTERQFARAVRNAKKTRRTSRRKLPLTAKRKQEASPNRNR
ncbi:MAG TPA: mechanosensitive ion channel family protein [Candidatus Saccharimonadales bacterium]|nr:mechanosensitive ion channel family protein [Candidatus Saccharimonadales bacterium]